MDRQIIVVEWRDCGGKADVISSKLAASRSRIAETRRAMIVEGTCIAWLWPVAGGLGCEDSLIVADLMSKVL
jgi:hypothetical protein